MPLRERTKSAVLSEEPRVLRCVHQAAATDVLDESGHHGWSVVASVIFFAVVCGRGGIGCSGTNRQSKVVRKASSVVGMAPDRVEAMTERKVRGKLNAMEQLVQPQTHPATCLGNAWGAPSYHQPLDGPPLQPVPTDGLRLPNSLESC